jgi:hypothetical protein
MAIARFLVATLLALLLLLGAAAPAGADPVSGGKARLELNRELIATLHQAGVRLSALAPARLRGRHLVLPVTGGQLTAGVGRVDVMGGLRLSHARESVSLSGLILDSEHGSLVEKTAGARVPLAVARRPRVRRDGFGYTVTLGKLVLTQDGVRRIEQNLGLGGLLGKDRTLGILNAGARRSQVTVTRGTAYLSLDESFAAKLRTLTVGGEPLGAGWTFTRAPLSVALTKLHGALALDLSSGTIESADGLRVFQGELRGGEIEPVAGAPEVTLRSVSIDLAAGAVAAEIRAQPSGAANTTMAAAVQISTFHRNAFTGEISIPNSPLTLSPPLAELLNQTFVEPRGLPPAFAAGEPFGFLAFSARTTGSPH